MYRSNASLCCWRKAWPQQISTLHCTDTRLTVLALNLLYTLTVPTSSQLHCLIREIINANYLLVDESRSSQDMSPFLFIFASFPVNSIINILVEFVYLICTRAKSILESYFLPTLVFSGSLDSYSCVSWLKLYTAIYPKLVYLIRLGHRL